MLFFVIPAQVGSSADVVLGSLIKIGKIIIFQVQQVIEVQGVCVMTLVSHISRILE